MFRRLILTAALIGAPVAALAHHGWSSYDAGKDAHGSLRR